MKYYVHFFVVLLTIMVCNSCTTNPKKKQKEIPQKKSVATALGVLPNATVKETIAYYHQLKKEFPEVYNFDDENELNNLGYQYLNNGKTKDAIEIFKLLVAEFPKAFNPYDSLGEAYLADGNTELAILNYEKSLALNPKNINAEDILTKIKYPTYDDTRFAKVYPITQYRQDLDELARRLTEINPNAYKFISKTDFWKLVTAKKAALTKHTTFSQFIWMCSEIVASIDCSHTSMGGFHQERKLLPVHLRFPMEVRLIQDKLYVTQPFHNATKVPATTEVLTINGYTVAELTAKIFPHISSQGSITSSKKNFFNAFTTAMIPYALGFPKKYTITVKGNANPILLRSLTTYKRPDFVPFNPKCKAPLCVDYMSNGHTAIMTVRTFSYYGRDFSKFKTFADASFKALKKKGIRNLILDVRHNGGGSSDAGAYLLRYLSQQPFTYFSSAQFNEKLKTLQPKPNVFQGNLYVTIDGNGGSTTGHFMSMVKYLKLGTLVGEELGSNQFCTGGQKRLRLPNTGIQFSVARNTYVTTATSLPIDRGIFPEYEVHQSITDYLNKVDTVMEYTMALIQQKETTTIQP